MEMKWKAGAGMLLAGLCAGSAHAAEVTDAEKRIVELEKQVNALVQSLQEVQQQLKQARTEDAAPAAPVATVKAGIRETGGLRDGLVFEDESGAWKLQFNGGVQGDFRHYSPDQQSTDTFSIRHARIITQLYLFKDFSFKLEGEYANDNSGAKATTTFTNGHMDFFRWPQAKLRAGQFRPLFGLEHITSDNLIGFQERSLTESLIQDIGFDRGVMVHGAPITGLYYSLALTNGTGMNLDNNNNATSGAQGDGFDVTGRVRANFADLLNKPDMVLHAGVSYNQGTMEMRTAPDTAPEAAYVLTAGRSFKFFDPEAFSGSDVDRTRWGVEGAWAQGPFKLQGEYMQVNYEGTSAGGTHYDRDIRSWYAEANWIATGENYPEIYGGGVFTRIRPKSNYSDNGYGALELGLRYSRFDASDFSLLPAGSPNPGTGVLINTASRSYSNEADEWTLAANWILNPFVRVMANYVRTNFDSDVMVNGESADHEDVVTMRAQFDF